MIRLILNSTLIWIVWIIINSRNPIKTSFSILISASVIFFYVKITSGITWLPLIFFILFTGGILMIFIILSSVLPNEKTIKVKYSKRIRLTILITTLIVSKYESIPIIATQTKRFLTSGLNLILITAIILAYFFNSINLNSNEETPMRSLQC